VRGVRTAQRLHPHKVQQQAVALHVAQEQRAQAGALGRALDQPGDVGDHEAARRLHADHAEVRVERGERIVRHLGGRGGDRADEGGLAGIGEPEQAHVGQQLQLQSQGALLALGARRRLPRGAVDRALEVHVAQAALPAARHQQAVAVADQVADHFVGVHVDDLRAHRHQDDHVLAALAVALLAHAVLAALGPEQLPVAEVHQGVEVAGGLEPDVAALAAVAAVRPAQRDELLAPEAHAAVAAVAGDDRDFSFVYEFHRGVRGDRARERPRRPGGPPGAACKCNGCGRRDRGGPSRPQRKAPPERGPSRGAWRGPQAPATTFTVRRFFGPLVVNSTVPSTSAYSVWSRPRPTPAPGWNWVPRWRTMMLPASMAWPPYIFTPRYFGLESRPLREEPTPFL